MRSELLLSVLNRVLRKTFYPKKNFKSWRRRCGPTQTIRLCFQYCACSIGSACRLPLLAMLFRTGRRVSSVSPRKASVRWMVSARVTRPPQARCARSAHACRASAASRGGQIAKNKRNFYPAGDFCQFGERTRDGRGLSSSAAMSSSRAGAVCSASSALEARDRFEKIDDAVEHASTTRR